MKGKMCEGNMNMAICILMGVLLLIIIWYVFMGPRKESFVAVPVDVAVNRNIPPATIDPIDLTYRALEGGLNLGANAIITPIAGPGVVPGTAVRVDARNPYI
jgi:hypothetical protein